MSENDIQKQTTNTHMKELKNDSAEDGCMDAKRIGIKNILFSIINQGNTETTDYVIAMYLLKNFKEVKNINIMEMAESCHVNRSTIRRFFVKYGCQSFSQFKRHFEDSYEEMYFQEIPYQSYGEYINSLNEKLYAFISDFELERDKTEDIEQVIDRIYRSNNLVLLGDESFYGNMYFVQQSMLSMKKITFLISGNVIDNPILKNLTSNDCMIVYSLRGKYYESIQDCIQDVPCSKMLFTLHKEKKWEPDFDYIAQLTRHPDDIDENIYRRYAFTYFTDIMITTYKMKYSDKTG